MESLVQNGKKDNTKMVHPQAASTPKPSKPTGAGLSPRSSWQDSDQSQDSIDHNSTPNSSTFDEFMESVSYMDEYSEDEPIMDLDSFFETCTVSRKGRVWKLYKPVDESGLYYKIFYQPKNTEELAYDYIEFSNRNSPDIGAYIIVKFLFDSAGFLNLNIKPVFTYPVNYDKLFHLARKTRVIEENFKSIIFLCKDHTKSARTYRLAIFNFIRKLLILGNRRGFLQKPQVLVFVKLLTQCVKETRISIPLLYTAYIFIAKMLTALCHVKSVEKVANVGVIDDMITQLYSAFAKFSTINDRSFDTLKIQCVKELAVWITYFPNIFINHLLCVRILQSELLEENTKVRLATMKMIDKMLKSTDMVKSCLRGDPINKILLSVQKSTWDINDQVRIQAFEVIACILSDYWNVISRVGVLQNIYQHFTSPDFRTGTGAGKCLIIMVEKIETTTEKGLLRLAKLTIDKPDDLKLFVESCYDHTDLLQNWTVILKCMEITTKEMEVKNKIMTALSGILREAANLALLGKPTVLRRHSKTDRRVDNEQHLSLADQLYPRLTTFISLYVNNDVVMRNIFETLVLIRPTCLQDKHHKEALSVITYFRELFTLWSEQKLLLAFLDFFLYVKTHIPDASEVCKSAIVNLKSDMAQQLYSEFVNDGMALSIMNKTAALYQKVDLNHHIMWKKLLALLTAVQNKEEFIESASIACQWSLVWSFKSLVSYNPLSPTTEKVQEICLQTRQLMDQYFEMLKTDQKSFKLKVFQRMCESCIHWSKEINQITKDERVAEKLRPSYKEYRQLVPEIIRFFDELIESVDKNTVTQYKQFVAMLFEMTGLRIVPVDILAVSLKNYYKYYDIYKELMETIMTSLKQKSENWLALLIAASLTMAYKDLLARHGAVDARSAEAKAILGLTQRFVAFKSVVSQNVITRTLHFILAYVAKNKMADLLLYLGPFAENTLEKEAMLAFLTKNILREEHNQATIYFMKKLSKKSAKPRSSTRKSK